MPSSNAAAQEAVPGAVLAVVTPGLDGGPAGAEARRVDLAGLTPGQAWRSVGLDLASWPGGPIGPAVLRGVSLSTDALAHDLATSPDLDAIVAGRPRRGLLLTIDGSPRRPAGGRRRRPTPAGATPAPRGPSIRLSALPLGDGPSADEPLGHALAALDAQWVFLAAGAAAGHEERLRRFAGVLRALPAWPTSPPGPSADPRALPFGTAVRSSGDATQSFLAIANDSPYPIRLACLLEAPETAVVEDLGRGFRLAPTAEAGGRNLVLDLLPFGVSAIRVGAPGVRVASLTAYPSEAVLAGMQARSRELSLQLARLNQGLSDGATEPANPGFEPAPESGRPPSPSPAAEAGPAAEPLPPLPGAADPGGGHRRRHRPDRVDRPAVPGGWRVEAGDAGASPARPGAAKASGRRDDRHRPGESALGTGQPAAVGARRPGLGRQRAVRAEPAIQPDHPGLLPLGAGGRDGAGLDRGGVGRPAVRPPIGAGRLGRVGGPGGPRLRPAAGGARLGPAAVRADDAGRPVDRRPAGRRRRGGEVGPAQRAADDAGGLAGLPRAAIRRLRAAGRLALGAGIGRRGGPAGPVRRAPARPGAPARRRRGFCPIAATARCR